MYLGINKSFVLFEFFLPYFPNNSIFQITTVTWNSFCSFQESYFQCFLFSWIFSIASYKFLTLARLKMSVFNRHLYVHLYVHICTFICTFLYMCISFFLFRCRFGSRIHGYGFLLQQNFLHLMWQERNLKEKRHFFLLLVTFILDNCRLFSLFCSTIYQNMSKCDHHFTDFSWYFKNYFSFKLNFLHLS